MSGERIRLQRGTLWARLVERTERAVRIGALGSIRTDREFLTQGGVDFVVRVISSLARKQQAARTMSGDGDFDPFLAYDEDLYVGDMSDTHVCLLNKFNVMHHHLLIVTRAFEHQEAPLSVGDFEALWRCMAEYDGLGFYNAGEIAGASQPHKHLQLVPLPLAPEGPRIPIEPLLSPAVGAGEGRAPGLRLVHALAPLGSLSGRDPAEAAAELRRCYRRLLEAAGIKEQGGRLGAYNLLATREWMLLVPRSVERAAGISINALGFAGALLVRDREELERLARHGPMRALERVAVAGGAW